MSSTWTTTTSATGMPTVDPDMSVTRSPHTLEHSSSAVNMPLSSSPRSTSPLIHGCSSSRSSPKPGESPTVIVKSANSIKPITQENTPKHRPTYFTNSVPSQLQGSPNIQRKSSPDVSPSLSLLNRRSSERGTSSPSLLRKSPDRTNAFRRVSKEEAQAVKDAIENARKEENDNDSDKELLCSCKCHQHKSLSEEIEKSNSDKSIESEGDLSPTEEFELPHSKELDELIDRITEWNFPIFKACEHGNILCQVCPDIAMFFGLD